MSSTARRVSWLGLALVLFGVLLLLRKFDVIDIRLREILWPLLILLGIVITGRGFADGRKGKIVFGTVLFLYSIFFFLRTLGDIHIPIDMFLPATFLVFGIVSLMLFINAPRDWYYLIPGAFLLGIGAMMVMAEYGYWYYWQVRDVVGNWWPAVLIVFGIALLLRHRQSHGGGVLESGDVSGSTGTPGLVEKEEHAGPENPEQPTEPEPTSPER